MTSNIIGESSVFFIFWYACLHWLPCLPGCLFAILSLSSFLRACACLSTYVPSLCLAWSISVCVHTRYSVWRNLQLSLSQDTWILFDYISAVFTCQRGRTNSLLSQPKDVSPFLDDLFHLIQCVCVCVHVTKIIIAPLFISLVDCGDIAVKGD